MSLFLVVPQEGQGGERAAQLARIVGAVRLSAKRAKEVLAMVRGEAGGPPFSLGSWALLEVPEAHPDRLSEISRFMRERVEAEGVALVDLDERLISLSELQEAAAGLGLSFELVAIVKHLGGEPGWMEEEDPEQVAREAVAELQGALEDLSGILDLLGASPVSRSGEVGARRGGRSPETPPARQGSP